MPIGSVLVSGASFAGLATAFWMRRAGYDVTVVETAGALREGGTPVNIKGRTIDIVRRMGLLDRIVANRIVTSTVSIWRAAGLAHRMDMPPPQPGACDEDYEVERDWLTGRLFSLVEGGVEMLFADSIASLSDGGDGVDVVLRSGRRRRADLVFGCDGIGSNTRRLVFGPADFSYFLNSFGSIAVVPRLLLGENEVDIYEAPGARAVLSAHHGKTDITALFSADTRIDYGPLDRAQRMALVAGRLAGAGWRIPELLGEIERADYYYFSELAQIRMPAWSRGRVALVGDAAYCASPAAGMGGSLALDGAAALADALAEADGDHVAGFGRYDAAFRPYLDEIQAAAVRHCDGLATGRLILD